MLLNGQWSKSWHPVQGSDAKGRFIRQTSSFRHRINNDTQFAVEAGRYVLYVAYICPWASRALIALRLKGLEQSVEVLAVDPRLSDEGWAFTGEMDSDIDRFSGTRHMHEMYTRADPQYSGRATVPVLWDRQRQTIVNNESADILQIFNHDLRALASQDIDLRPADIEDEIERVNRYLYSDFNNGVYQAGFAGSQGAYDEAVKKVFGALNWMEMRLSESSFLVGARLTEADIRAFVTLVRFELAYYDIFKCNLRPLTTYRAVYDYLTRLLRIPAFATSVRPDHIKAGYYSIKALNPSGIVPAGPELPYLSSIQFETGREELAGDAA